MSLQTYSKGFAVAAALLSASALVGHVTDAGAAAGEAGSRDRPPACAALPPPNGQPPPKPTPATVTTIGRAYYCIFAHYYSGPVLDDRSLLVPAFAGLTQELQRRRLDQPQATMPALTGDRDHDWAAFSRVYEQITARLPDAGVRQAVADAAMQGMLDSLHDDHVAWASGFKPNTTGIGLSAVNAPFHVDPTATEPLFVTEVGAGGPADRAGVRPGDEIVAVNDVPPYVNGVLSEGVIQWLTSGAPGTQVKLTLHRPASGATFIVTVTAGPQPPGSPPASRLVDGNVGYVPVPAFAPKSADQALAAIAQLRRSAQLRGVVLDLRGNGGGSPDEVARLLGALVHDRVTSYWCDVRDHCTANHSDDSVELLRLPVVVLTDRRCASTCESFSSTVKDLHLGALVGTRSAGIVAGPAEPWLLDNGTLLQLPKLHEIGANREVVDTIGVAPDHYAPLTAADLSAGRDPGLDEAVTLLR
jgi:carboxyl-terminal processing protease